MVKGQGGALVALCLSVSTRSFEWRHDGHLWGSPGIWDMLSPRPLMGWGRGWEWRGGLGRQEEAGLTKAVDLESGSYPASVTDLGEITPHLDLHFFVFKMVIIRPAE